MDAQATCIQVPSAVIFLWKTYQQQFFHEGLSDESSGFHWVLTADNYFRGLPIDKNVPPAFPIF